MVISSLPLTASAVDNVYINSQKDWTNFCSKYNKTEVNVFLNCDVKFDTKGYQMERFIGTLDGQGHSFIFNYKDDKSGDQNKDYYDEDWDEDSAPFMYATGTIKNLRLTGTIAVRYGAVDYRRNNALSASTKDSLTIENCCSDVAFVNTGTKAVGISAQLARVGGFLGAVVGPTKFNNCSFTGSFIFTDPDEGHNYYDTGGFVGTINSMLESTVEFNNCISYIKYDDRGTVKRFSYFVGYVPDEKQVTVNNCYGYCVNWKGEEKKLPNDEKCTVLSYTSAQLLKSGDYTWKLNGGDGTGKPWVQTIGVDSVPRLRTFYPTSYDVHFKQVTTHLTNTDGWSTFFSPIDFSLPTGVTPYVVTGINETEKKVTVSPYSGSISNVPLLLYNEGSSQQIAAHPGYYNVYNTVGYLRGTFDNLAASDSYRVIDDEGTFVKPTADIPAWNCYLTGATADSYTIDISGGDYGDIVLINSTDDWNDFCINYSGKKVTAYLGSDITISDSDRMMEKFTGTFDGQGHQIINANDNLAFNYAEGVIKNLRYIKALGPGIYPLVGNTSTSLSFTDCFSNDQLHSKANVSGVTYTHTLEYNGTSVVYDTSTSHTAVSDSLCRSGEVTYKLNAGRTGSDAVWTQTIGEDNLPQLLSTTSKEVFCLEGSTRAASSNQWTTLYYLSDVTLPDGVEQYGATSVDGLTVNVARMFESTVKACTPVLLHAAKGMPELTLPTVYYNELPTPEDNLLAGVTEETTATENVRTLSGDKVVDLAKFNQDNTTIPAWQCYLNRSDYETYFVRTTGVLIASKDDWTTFKTQYNNTEVTVYLGTDLTLTSDDEAMESFKGTLEGQGHTITVNYDAKSSDKTTAVLYTIKQASGVFRNLNIDGTIYYCDQSSSTNRQFPWVYDVAGTEEAPVKLDFENCHIGITYALSPNEKKIFSEIYDFAGFIRSVSKYATVNFNDCSSTIAFKMRNDTYAYPKLGLAAGYVGSVGEESDGVQLNFTNCLSDLSGSEINNGTDGFYYFCNGDLADDGTTEPQLSNVSFTNCYAQVLDGVTADPTDDANHLSGGELATGEITYALNAGRTGSDVVWTQTIGTDTVPQLALFSADSKEVFLGTDTVRISTSGWTTHYYPVGIEKPEGVTVYTVSGARASGKSGNSETSDYILQLTEVEDSIPANTPVLLCTLAEGETEATVTTTIEMPEFYYNEFDENDIEDNSQNFQLVGITHDLDTYGNCYVLQTDTDSQGNAVSAFRYVGQTTETALSTVPAWQCLLYYTGDGEDEASKTGVIYLREAHVPTAIDAAPPIDSLLGTGRVYDLQGRQVQSLRKGQVYIKNGQKFMVK